MESYASSVSAKWSNVGVGVGYADGDTHFGFGVGLKSTSKPFTTNDTVVLGSGAKPFVAAMVMRLVDQGKVTRDDKAALHIDPVMQRLWNTTFAELLGTPSASVTVGHLLRMQSGLADMDVVRLMRLMLFFRENSRTLLGSKRI